MQAALRTTLADRLHWQVPRGGFFLWVRAPRAPTPRRCLDAALAEGVSFVPGSAFFAGGLDGAPVTGQAAWLRLAFSAVPPDRIRRAWRGWRGCWRLGDRHAGQGAQRAGRRLDARREAGQLALERQRDHAGRGRAAAGTQLRAASGLAGQGQRHHLLAGVHRVAFELGRVRRHEHRAAGQHRAAAGRAGRQRRRPPQVAVAAGKGA